MSRVRALAVGVSAALLTGCSAAGAVTTSGSDVRTPEPVTSGSGRSTPSPAHGAHLLSPPQVPGISWRPEGSVVQGRAATYVAQSDGGAIGLLWIDPTVVTFRLVPGVKVPEGGPALPADNSASTWVPRMVAAFNGGFLLKDRVGGYFYAHRMVRPLVDGLAALEITSDGHLSVGSWGRDLRLTAQTVAVRENLPLLVDGSRARTSVRDTPRTWGVANGGLWTANRSALGQLGDGSLVFVYGHEVRAPAMAAALVRVGVQRAMVLDMNKSWPGGFVYWPTAHGVAGSRIQPLEYHSPSVYFARYTKDFVAVLRR